MHATGTGGRTIAGLTLIAASGLALYAWQRSRRREEQVRLARPAYAEGVEAGTPPRGAAGQFRPAGKRGMRDPRQQWDPIDEGLDETFPASDPPANY